MNSSLDHASRDCGAGWLGVLRKNPSIVALYFAFVISAVFIGPWSILVGVAAAVFLYGPWIQTADFRRGRGWQPGRHRPRA